MSKFEELRSINLDGQFTISVSKNGKRFSSTIVDKDKNHIKAFHGQKSDKIAEQKAMRFYEKQLKQDS